MVNMTINATTMQNKDIEFRQSLNNLKEELKKEKGYSNFTFFQASDDQNIFHIETEWSSRPVFESFVQSKLFAVLLGSIKVLCESQETRIFNVPKIMGMELIEKIRKDTVPKNKE